MHEASKRIFFQAMMQWSAGNADRLIAISESTRQDVIRLLSVASSKIVSTQLAASSNYCLLPPFEVESVVKRYNLIQGKYIYFVGALEPRKNIPLLIEAYAKLGKQFSDVPLIIAGKKGWMYHEIFKRVAALNLQDRVRFLGYVPEQDLIALYNGARVFVYPSYYEGFGFPVLEAMQCGTPVITTNVSSMPEVAGDAALLVPPNDVEALSIALQRVLTDDVLAKNLSQRGLARAVNFSWQRCAKETLQVYESVCLT
jgi:glycosyltransferase involved in cell wall biosynthesis